VTERLFFALWPGAGQRAELTRIQRDLHLRHAREAHPDDLHVTLAFLGDVEPDRRACAEAGADRVVARPFELLLDRVGSFPRARVVWCGASRQPQALTDLVGALNRELLGCGFPPERRPYTPHVTLARKARLVKARGIDHPVSWPVAAFVLVATGEGPPPHYRVVRRWPLA
jgi:2'-5' RNA ligase